ncbi:ubiquitin-conjugating enzyme/RWD-like protein [Pyronema domesticum]|uniref:Similar to Ubiquitin-conjugating enzyme E2 6 acc. no. Q6CMG6 n=1 Tax=Pyronema omphalodes (strain CBS 100304) TaxID=1076935 RepID=U4KZE6_PYROM|nr:ubiquitin-conjugating enzyme/RWD-like protein [Pyronema domesticum]CCX07845.1 Similar to Ubiquitin-conjugating enzyme E2 6; acc. no. Q6CMG6 [Pyronema omphalodes CBS 100304]
MATPAANKRLTREYKAITANPPPYISAHPSETNILEWHYLLTGPPATPYEGGQYWGTLVFPPDYPFKPPAIRMITPSGRFQTSTRLCLSISDFHPKSFNPAWEVSTILIGLLSFMTGDEMTTGSISSSDRERKVLAQNSRWWNSTGGGSAVRMDDGRIVHAGSVSAGRKIGLGDAGQKFRQEFPEEDEENWKWMKEKSINPITGTAVEVAAPSKEAGAVDGVRKRAVQPVLGSGGPQQAAVVVARGEGWLRRNKVAVGIAVVVVYVLLARAFE